MKERILVPLDGTESGEAILPHLESLVLDRAPGQDIEVTLLRVLPIVNFNVLTTDERAQLPYTEEDRKNRIGMPMVIWPKCAVKITPKRFSRDNRGENGACRRRNCKAG